MTRGAPICILLALAGPALGADDPVIGMVGAHVSDVHAGDRMDLERALAVAVDRSGRASALGGSGIAGAIFGRQQIILEEALLSDGRRLLGEGRNLRNQALFEDALPVLEQAVARLEDGVLAGDLRDLWEAWVLRGACHLALGQEEPAAVALQQAVALNAVRVPDPALYPPDLVTLHDAVRSAGGARTTTLTVTTPRELAVSVDGGPPVVVGTGETGGQLRLADRLPGTHHVRGSAPGWHASVRVVLDGSPVTTALEPGRPTLGTPSTSDAARARQTTDLYRAFGRHTEGVDYLLLAGTAGTLLHLQLYDVRADAFSRPTSVPFADTLDDEIKQMVPLLLTLIGPDGSLSADNTQASAVPLDRSTNARIASLLLDPPSLEAPRIRRKRTGLWVGLGAAVLAAGGTGAAVAAASGGPRYDGTITIGPIAR